MPLRFYTNMISQASRSMASGILVVGLLLIGFGLLIFVLRDLFAFLAAALFFVAGAGCLAFAAKVFWMQWRLDRFPSSHDEDIGRINVRIRTGDRDEF